MTFYRACIRHVFASLLLCAALVSFTGNAFAYCASRGGSSYEWIQSTSIAGVSQVSGNNGGYVSFTQPVINLNAGTHSITLTPGGSYTEYWKVWIDFNNNDDFGTDEVVYSGSGRTLNGSITIPATAASGERGMRISMKYGSTPAPCGNFTYGEVEDYRVYLNTTDTTAPAVASKTPAAGAIDVSRNTTITVTFSENPDPESVSDSSISLSKDGLYIPGTVSLNGNVATFTPAQTLAYSSQYLATVHAGVSDLAGNMMSQDITWSFSTIGSDLTPPTVSSTLPQNGATDVLVHYSISIQLSERVDPQTVNSSTVLVNNGAGNIAGNVVLNPDHRSIVFYPAQNLDFLTTHTATITTGVRDEAGNNLQADHVWSFTTREYEPAYCASTASNITLMWISQVRVGTESSSSPGGGTGYSNNTSHIFYASRTEAKPIVLTRGGSSYPTYWRVFIDWNRDGTLATDEIAFSGSGTPVSGTITVPYHAVSGNTRMRVSMQYNAYPPACGTLTYGEVEDYRINIPALPPDTTPPAVTAAVPADGTQNVDVDTVVSADFSETMDATTINGVSFSLTGASGPVTATVSYDAQNKRAVLTPAAPLDYSSVYTATLSGVEDLAGNMLPENHSWSFTTQPDPGPLFSVSGKVLYQGAGHLGVTITLSGDGNYTTTTGNGGVYSFPEVPPGSYVVTPAKAGFFFTPENLEIDVLDSNIGALDFSATLPPSPQVNGNFETGDFTGYTTFLTTNGQMVNTVETFDTDNDGIASMAAKFNVSTNVGFQYNGGGIYQVLNLKQGDLWVNLKTASSNTGSSSTSDGGYVRVYLDGQLKANHDFGSVAANSKEFKVLTIFTYVSAGAHELRISITKYYGGTSTTSSVYVDDIVLTGSSTQ